MPEIAAMIDRVNYPENSIMHEPHAVLKKLRARHVAAGPVHGMIRRKSDLPSAA